MILDTRMYAQLQGLYKEFSASFKNVWRYTVRSTMQKDQQVNRFPDYSEEN